MSKDILIDKNGFFCDELRLPRPNLKAGSAIYTHWDQALITITPEERASLMPEVNPLDQAGKLYHELQIDKRYIENTHLVPGYTILGIHDAVNAAGWLWFEHLFNFRLLSPNDLYQNTEYMKIVESMHPELILIDTYRTDSKSALRDDISLFRQNTNLFLQNRERNFPLGNNVFDTEYLLGLNYMFNRALVHLK